jgi:hypothetical protein
MKDADSVTFAIDSQDKNKEALATTLERRDHEAGDGDGDGDGDGNWDEDESK